HDLVGAGFDFGERDGDVALDVNAEFRGIAGHVRDLGTGDHGFGGSTAGVDAGASEDVAFDEGDGFACGGESDCEKGACLTGADDDGVEVGGHGSPDLRERGRKLVEL